VKNAGIHKGIAGQRWLSQGDLDFVLAIGDDWTDEDMFAVLPDGAYSIRIGLSPTKARFQLHESEEVLRLLEALVQRGESGEVFQQLPGIPTYH
jgi:trehalose 6-phosphate synthase/phosphatase